jgi:hypothetical protein
MFIHNNNKKCLCMGCLESELFVYLVNESLIQQKKKERKYIYIWDMAHALTPTYMNFNIKYQSLFIKCS